MGLRYASTILVEGDEPTNRAMLDMLKKVNEVDADLTSLSQTTQSQIDEINTEIVEINTEIADLAIISGSDANGSFFQTPDGYMICNIRLNLGTASQSWTFPKVFVNTPTVVGMMVSGSNARIITLDNVSSTSCTVLGWTDAGAASSDARNVVAYGFWK